MNTNYAIYYNHETIGDVLMIVFDSQVRPDEVISKGDVTILKRNETVIGYNLFNISNVMKIKANGFIPRIDKAVLEVINSILVNAGEEPLKERETCGFKVAKIVEIEEHPDSEHLHICKVDIGAKDCLQIVCGAYNARENLLCVCALPYAFMPNGQQIIPSKLLGIESYGMLCSGRELALPGYEGKRGLLELDDSYKVGEDFF